MEHVSDDRDVQAGDPTELLVDGVEVEERLRRVLVRPVSRVDDVRGRRMRDDVRRADVRVADDDDVGVVGADRQRGVLQRLALVDGRAVALIDMTSAESRLAASSKLEDVRVEDS